LVSAQTTAPVSTAPKLTGYLQPRFQTTGDSATFVLRRARFAIEGAINAWATYRAQVEMRTLGAPATPPRIPSHPLRHRSLDQGDAIGHPPFRLHPDVALAALTMRERSVVSSVVELRSDSSEKRQRETVPLSHPSDCDSP